MRSSLKGKVVVLTGATSGIGRATAKRLARKGASLVVAARDAGELDEVRLECGGNTLAVAFDAADPEQVSALATAAEEQFGHIDVWVNDAAVSSYGRLEDIPVEEIRRILDVNVLGYTLGMQEALRRFRAQHHGVIVNVASLVSGTGVPFQAPYVMSKHAVRGLSESVRMELHDEKDIHVCAVLPGAIDTPFFQHAANHSGRELKAPNPTIRPGAVARAIVGCIKHPRRERAVGFSTRMLLLQHRFAPRLSERLVGWYMRHDQFSSAPAVDSSGSLFQPLPGSVRGGWRRFH